MGKTVKSTAKNTAGLMPPWKKGQSGNPNGRPRKEICLTSLIKEELEQVMQTDDGPRTKAQILAKNIVSKAAKGHNVAMKEVLDRIDGKVADKLEMNAKVSDDTQREEDRTVDEAIAGMPEPERKKFYELLKLARNGSVAGTA